MAETLKIGERQGLGLATVMVRKGADAAALGAKLGLELVDGARVSHAGPLGLIGVGPGVWLAMVEDAPSGWVRTLAESLAGVASVSEQSSGYQVLRFSGPGAGPLLQKGAFVDLDPEVFPVGAAAVTAIAHIGVVLWKADAAPSFDVALFRSYADSFRHWIASSAGPSARLS